MTPLHQTIFDFENGNCFATCIASILDLPLNLVPNFCAKGSDTFDVDGVRENWYRRAELWLAERGWSAVMFDWQANSPGLILPNAWAVISGKSPRNAEKHHAVVGRVRSRYFLDSAGPAHQLSYELVHDPHPAGDFIAGAAVDILVLIPGVPKGLA